MDFEKLLPKRNLDTDKRNYGRVLVVAGSPGYSGAAYFASSAAMRTGSGLVILAAPETVYPILAVKLNEVIVRSFLAIPGEGFSKRALIGIKEEANQADVLAIGPGLGHHPQTAALVKDLILEINKPVILDADGLNAFEGREKALRRHRGPLVVTPHQGEFARLTGKSKEETQSQKTSLVKQFAKTTGAVVLLKGNRTLVASPDGELYENQSGNPGMATAGAGDVLTGMIASLVGQRIPLYAATCLGAYLHGVAGDLVAKEKGEYGLIAGDILDKIPQAIAGVAQR
jgi:NAD(P)H-hydrate epimerase